MLSTIKAFDSEEKEKLSEQLDVYGLAVQFFYDGKWGPLLELAPYIHDTLKKEMRQTEFRFILYGQLGCPMKTPQAGEPEHE
jgi:hypothetical protein